MEKGKRMEFEASLPEAMIHHIQSFLSGKEAARTTLLSKSWYNAWLTRPSLAFDQRDFENSGGGFSWAKLWEFAAKTMRRYRGLNLKIESLRLQTQSSIGRVEQLTHRMIVDALEIGATDLNLESLPPFPYTLPQELLQSDTLLRLSVEGCEIDGKFKCSMLRSLSLDNVVWQRGYMATDMISCCISIEELSISNSSRLTLSRKHLHTLRKLERLHLEVVNIDYSFFDDLDSRFPCLQDLSLVRCQYDRRSRTIRISSTSLRRIRIVQLKVMKGKFTALNLACFSYSGMGMPSLSLEARECECHISLKTKQKQSFPWFQRLQKLLIGLSPSKINLSLSGSGSFYIDEKRDFKVVGEAVVVENVTIEAGVLTLSRALLLGLLRICRPKFVRWESTYPDYQYKHSLKSLWDALIREMITPDCGVRVPVGRLGLKEVHMQFYKRSLTQWCPLVLEGPVDALIDPPNGPKVRFELKW